MFLPPFLWYSQCLTGSIRGKGIGKFLFLTLSSFTSEYLSRNTLIIGASSPQRRVNYFFKDFVCKFIRNLKESYVQNLSQVLLWGCHWKNDYIWVKVFKNGPSRICGRQPLKYLKWYDYHIASKFLKAVFHKFQLVHFWMSWPIYMLC